MDTSHSDPAPHRHRDGHDQGTHDPKGHDPSGHDHDGHGHDGHDHGGHDPHGHGGHRHHHHPTPPANLDLAFAVGAGLNTLFVVAELSFGIAANSVALVADAVHNMGDVLSLLLGWGAAWLSRRPPTLRRSYGWGRSSIMASLVNAAILLVSVGAIGWESVDRLLAPQPVAEGTVIWVALVGIAVNGGSALLFMRDRGSDLNVRAQFLHLAADAAVSLGVVVAAIAIQWTGLQWLDPATSIAIAVVIAVTSWGVLRESVDLAMDAVPEQVPHEDVQAWLAGLPGVTEVHDLHIWGLSTTETALTAHLVCAAERDDRRLFDLTTELRRRFRIGHATLQIESEADAALCRLRPNDVV